MKRLITVLIILLALNGICYAGSIPEDLLNFDEAQVYFGKVLGVDGDKITIIQHSNIKGAFIEGNQITYNDYVFTPSPKKGQIYLCGYFDENNPLYIWETTTLKTKTLKIKNKDELSGRMQTYLNKGLFEEKEQERLIALNVTTTSDIESQTTDYIKVVIRFIIFVTIAIFVFLSVMKKQRYKQTKD